MISDKEIKEAIDLVLPADIRSESQPQIHLLSQIIASIINDQLPWEVAKNQINNDDGLQNMLKHLSGQTVKASESIIAFGTDNQLGDLSFRDVAGNDVYKFTINLTGQNPNPSDEQHRSQGSPILSAIREEKVTDEHEAFTGFFTLNRDDGLALILPRFPIDKLKEAMARIANRIPDELTEIKAEVQEALQLDLGQHGAYPTTKRVFDITPLAENDVETYVRIRNFFDKYHNRTPELYWDDWAFEDLLVNNKPYINKHRLLIAIGLFSNTFAAHCGKVIKKRFDKTLLFKLNRIKGNGIDAVTFRNRKYKTEDVNEEQVDYGIVARLKLSEQQYLMIIGGIKPASTEMLGKYIFTDGEWMSLFADYVKVKGLDEFVFVFKIQLKGSRKPPIGLVDVFERLYM
jgi:hypothetical protein